MRLKSRLWISVLVFLIGSVSVVAFDRDQNQGERSREGRESSHRDDRTPPQGMRGSENNRADEGERDKQWREYLKERNKAYKERAKANREEQNDFDRYRREREKDMREEAREREKDRRESVREADKDYRERVREREKDRWEDQREREKAWREYLKERKRAYRDYSRASRQERDDFDNYRRDRGYQYGGQYGSWGGGNEPRNGVCFYMDSNYNGESFCVNSNERQSYVGGRYNDRISSIRVFGRARRIVVYEHENYGGSSRIYAGDVPGLGNFNDKISSIEVR